MTESERKSDSEVLKSPWRQIERKGDSFHLFRLIWPFFHPPFSLSLSLCFSAAHMFSVSTHRSGMQSEVAYSIHDRHTIETEHEDAHICPLHTFVRNCLYVWMQLSGCQLVLLVAWFLVVGQACLQLRPTLVLPLYMHLLYWLSWSSVRRIVFAQVRLKAEIVCREVLRSQRHTSEDSTCHANLCIKHISWLI